MTRKTLVVVIMASIQIALAYSGVLAAGFAILQQGTAPMAQANAFVAQADDPTAVFFNPAGINALKGTKIYLGSTAILPKAKYQSTTGTAVETESQTFFVPQLYITQELTPHLTAGIGAFPPFGLGTKWPDTWPGRYLATSSDLKTYNLNPVLSWQVSPQLAVAGGVNVLYAKADLRKHLNLGLYPDGIQAFKGSDYGYAYNLGVLYKPAPSTNLGLSFRSQTKVKIDGDAELSVPAPVSQLFPSGGAHSQFVFPPSANAGIAYKGINPWIFEFDITWTCWSTFEELRVDLDRPVGQPPQSFSIQPRSWNDTWAFRFGINYKCETEPITLRAGYIFDQSPVPDQTLDPSIPDSDKHIFCVGGDFRTKALTIGLAYNFILGEERDKNNNIGSGNNPVNGEYQQRSHSVALSILYAF